MGNQRSAIAVAAVLVALATPAARAEVDGETLDIAAVKSKLRVLTDGKKHFIAVNPEEISDEFFFYGDGKTMWGQRTGSGGRNGEDFSRTFWEPRVKARYQASFQFRDKKYELQCDERKTAFAPLPEAEAKA